MTRREFLASAAAAPLAAADGRSTLGFTPDSFVIARPPRTALEFLDYVYNLGGGGVQATLASVEPAYLKQVREKWQKLGLYFEVLTSLPKDDNVEQFEATVKAAKEAGAECLRAVCLGGRRYETFSTMEQWKAFVADSRARLARAARIVEKHRMTLGVENHKDWTVEEMVPLMKEFGGEYMGVCFDFGNNISLLDDPVELAEQLAPWIYNTHIKDMGVEEYPDGFLLAEVPLGQGCLDLKKILGILLKARPKMKFSLDMLTRNPLQIPCLTEKYWVTYTQRHGRYLARTLAMVRANKPAKPLTRVDGMDQETKLKFEMDNVKQSLAYARDHLGLRP